MHLHQRIADEVTRWRSDGYACESYPAIGEILEFQTEEGVQPRFLRPPQIRALETYWYLRLAAETPRVPELYATLFDAKKDRLDAMGVPGEAFESVDYDLGELWSRIRTDDDFVRSYNLESLRETLTLDYPSYILALAMGAGKTILIGSIIATEFAMADEYPDGPFIQNALVFAPGKTIIEALRELLEVPYERILPPRMYKAFAAQWKPTFTRDGDPDIPVIRGSLFNVVVTNTEKIRIQKEAVRKGDLTGSVWSGKVDEAKAEVANRRLRAIASLPHLGIFSDEAHHTYGQNLLGKWVRNRETGEREFRESGIKKVRRTVDYLAEETNVVCVVNTTGTPYFERQPLRDVVIWYGLSEGIADGILKDVRDNIFSYRLDDIPIEELAGIVVKDFFSEYRDVHLQDGTPAKLAIYLPQTGDVADVRPAVERALADIGLPPTTVLEHHTNHEETEEFNRFHASEKRVALLVNRGTEGWNVPALFACALLRRLRTSNNFVLQAATRCLRQVSGNKRPARIYLSSDNETVLDRQLRETYGETLADLKRSTRERGTETIMLRKWRMPPVVLRRKVRRVVRAEENNTAELRLTRPSDRTTSTVERRRLSVRERAGQYARLTELDSVHLEVEEQVLDLYSTATELAAVHRLSASELRHPLRAAYPGGEVPAADVPKLSEQIAAHQGGYEVVEETVEDALALVRLDPRTGTPHPDGWQRVTDAGGEEAYVTEITYFKDRADLLLHREEVEDSGSAIGFHYTPYNFDSEPERDFYERMLTELGEDPEGIEDIYFTGAITSPTRTEFFVEYRDHKGKWRRYSPDFLVRRKDGVCVLVEVKAERERSHPDDGESGRKAKRMRDLEGLDPNRLRYRMIFTATESIDVRDLQEVQNMIMGGEEVAAGEVASEWD